ncbi:MAG: hypothetical protein N2450_03170 [bacterium]|nr:hypothetical protein [bacterium]
MAKQKKITKIQRPLFSKRNWRWLGTGIGVILLGYLALMQGPYNNPLSLTVAPILLTIGYCILIPIGLAIRPHLDEQSKSEKK